MTTLGDQWGICVLPNFYGDEKGRSMIISGPYRYIRHPIYAAYYVELIALALIPNCYVTLLFALFVNVPIQVIRSKIEEKELLSYFGEQYATYRANVPAFCPRIFIKRNGQQRRIERIIDFPERRKR